LLAQENIISIPCEMLILAGNKVYKENPNFYTSIVNTIIVVPQFPPLSTISFITNGNQCGSVVVDALLVGAGLNI
jgi:hypothetical protein